MAPDLRPMLATPGELPGSDDGWQFEFKWDGIRLIVEIDEGQVRCWSRNLNDLTASWPELKGLGEALGLERAVLDGEVVVMNEQSRPDFGLLQQRMHVSDPATAARLAGELPATLLVFDLLELGEHDLRALPLAERRRVLDDLAIDGPAWKVPPVFSGDGAATLDAAAHLGLEGVVAKRLDGRYLPGVRSDGWRKIKLLQRDEFVVVGSTGGTGRRASSFGALVLAVMTPQGWRGVGSVGTGFDDATLDELGALLAASEVEDRYWIAGTEHQVLRPVQPELVVEVAYSGWTRDGVLRHPAYVGRRVDRPAEEVTAPPGAPW